MKLFIAVVIVLALAFCVVFYVTKDSPQPTQADIEFLLKRNLGFSPIKWEFKFGKETKTSKGIPAWPVIYNITTSSVGTETKIITVTYLFYKEGYDWKIEKVE